MNFDEQRNIYKEMVERALKEQPFQGAPELLRDAMRYSLLAGGKRIRPVLMLMAYHLLKDDVENGKAKQKYNRCC